MCLMLNDTSCVVILVLMYFPSSLRLVLLLTLMDGIHPYRSDVTETFHCGAIVSDTARRSAESFVGISQVPIRLRTRMYLRVGELSHPCRPALSGDLL
ncbi:hypothetical protein HD554DRAFT_2118188 [Boletus coccyginus]|nr:hypothetical protein HD554DRAFT_2118188 [Boletus coccyginus]